MPIYDANARLALVGARGARRITDNEISRPARDAEKAENERRQATAEARGTPEFIDAETEAIKAQNQQLAAKQAKQATFDAFRRYTGDFSPKHLNTLLKDEPSVRKAFGDVVNFSKVNLETDRGLLNREGITEENFNSNRYLKVILPDGKEDIYDISEMMLGTGYLNYIQNEELDLLIKRAQLFGKPKNYAPGELERDATFASETLGVPLEDTTQSLYNKKVGGITPGKQALADEAIASMEEKTKEAGGFFNTDFTDRNNRILVESDIRRFEALSGQNLSAKDRADLKDLNTLVKMAGQVDKTLTSEVTGLFDTWFRDLKKYVTDDVAEVDKQAAASAYGAFRNTVRHALFGSALTDGEIKAFNEAFGTLKQSYPAVVTQFKTALQQTRSKLNTISQLNNPYLAHYYLGKSADELDVVIGRLDERIEYMSKLQRQDTPESVSSDEPELEADGLTPEQRRNQRFTDIFGPAPQSN